MKTMKNLDYIGSRPAAVRRAESGNDSRGRKICGARAGCAGLFAGFLVVPLLTLVAHAALVLSDDFEAGEPKFPWYLDFAANGANYVIVTNSDLFGSQALCYRMVNTHTGQKEAVGQMPAPVDMSSAEITSLTVQFDFYFTEENAPALQKAFNFGIGSSMGTPLTNHEQLTTVGADDRSLNSYIGWKTPYCRIQYQLNVLADGHGRGGTLATTTSVPEMNIQPNTIGTARMTLIKNGDLYDIVVEYRIGTNDFTVGLIAQYAQTISTTWDQVLFGWGLTSGYPPQNAFLFMDNLLIYTNGDPTPSTPPAPPSLAYQVVEGQLVLTWPTNANWQLQGQTNTLGVGLNPTSWAPVTGAAAGYYAQPLNTGNGATFYRLTNP